MINKIKIKKRVTTTFLKSIPTQLKHFDAYLYAVVQRKPEKIVPGVFGTTVRIDPCTFDWETKTIRITIPLNINDGITNEDDLDPSYFEALQVAFLLLMQNSV